MQNWTNCPYLCHKKALPLQRLLVIILNTIIICSPHLQAFSHSHILLGVETTCRFMDYVGCIVAAIMFVMYLFCFIKDAHYFAKIDPLKKHE